MPDYRPSRRTWLASFDEIERAEAAINWYWLGLVDGQRQNALAASASFYAQRLAFEAQRSEQMVERTFDGPRGSA